MCKALEDWPREALIGEKDYIGVVAEVTEDRVDEIRAECRTIANMIQNGEITTMNDVYEILPLEALNFLAELVKKLYPQHFTR